MTVQMDLPELGLTGEAILTDIRSAPAIEPPVDHLETRQVVTATFHHSSGDVIDLVVADSRSFLPGLPGRTFAAGEPQCRAVVPTAQPRNQGVNDWDNRSAEVAASREVLSGREGQQEPASDSPLSALGSPLSPACEVGHSNHEPAESEETIGTTSNHPFWSVDRQEFVQARSLKIGERLQTLSGDVKVVQQKLPRPGPQPVFNLEVHNEHVYFVGEAGVLVHNAYDVTDATARRAYLNQKFGRTGNLDADINARTFGASSPFSAAANDQSILKSIRRHTERLVSGAATPGSVSTGIKTSQVRAALRAGDRTTAGTHFHSLNAGFAREVSRKGGFGLSMATNRRAYTSGGAYRIPDYRSGAGTAFDQIFDLKPRKSSPYHYYGTDQFDDFAAISGSDPVPLYYRLRLSR